MLQNKTNMVVFNVTKQNKYGSALILQDQTNVVECRNVKKQIW